MDTKMIEKNDVKKPGMKESNEIYRAPALVSALRVVRLVLLLVVLIMFLNLVGIFSFLRGYFYLLAVATIGFLLMILATLALRHVYRDDECAKRRLPKLGWLLMGLVTVLIMGAAFPTSSQAIAMNQERICEEDLARLGQAVERYAAEKGRLPDSLERLIEEKFLDYVPKVGRTAIQYRIDTANGKSTFVLIGPDAGKLSKPRGFLPARKCKDIRYVQGRGLVVETE